MTVVQKIPLFLSEITEGRQPKPLSIPTTQPVPHMGRVILTHKAAIFEPNSTSNSFVENGPVVGVSHPSTISTQNIILLNSQAVVWYSLPSG